VIADSLGGVRDASVGPTCDWPLVALSGPNIAGEIARYLPATGGRGGERMSRLARRVQAAFSTQWFRVYTNDDLVGVELAGAIKNVIAIAAGIIDGLGAGNNAKAALGHARPGRDPAASGAAMGRTMRPSTGWRASAI
jgi:glycerol-3-phosphate dehydrogenase (NAD(P)+)